MDRVRGSAVSKGARTPTLHPLTSLARRRLLEFMLGSPALASMAALSTWWPSAAHARPELAIPETAKSVFFAIVIAWTSFAVMNNLKAIDALGLSPLGIV